MKRYLIGLMLSGAAARINRYTSGMIRRKPSAVGRIGRLLIGAGVGATIVWQLAQKRGLDKGANSHY
jgi:hypothetical protein